MLAYLDTLLGFSVVMLGVSLLITILDQVVSAFLAHRGSNLRWGLEVLFSQINPGFAGLPVLTANGSLLAETVLAHPLASDSTFSTGWADVVQKYPFWLGLIRRWRLANAIRPDELVAILDHVATNRPPGMAVGLHAMLSAEIIYLLRSPSAIAMRQGNLATAVASAVPQQLVGEAVGVVEAASGNLEAWFAKIMDRVSQRFTTWMRLWTVLFAFAIAFASCLDAFRLLSELYRNGDLRSQLVSAAPQVTDIAKRIIPPGSATPNDAVNKDVTRMYTEALQKAAKDANIPARVPDTASSAQANAWIDQNVPEVQRAAMRSSLEANWQAQMSAQVQDAKQIWTVLSASNLPSFGWSGWNQCGSLISRFIGVLVSALLLSLGAPFWYNTLATLTNLRPSLVSKQKSQDQAKLAKQAQPLK